MSDAGTMKLARDLTSGDVVVRDGYELTVASVRSQACGNIAVDFIGMKGPVYYDPDTELVVL